LLKLYAREKQNTAGKLVVINIKQPGSSPALPAAQTAVALRRILVHIFLHAQHQLINISIDPIMDP
jgi:hypothetical protein